MKTGDIYISKEGIDVEIINVYVPTVGKICVQFWFAGISYLGYYTLSEFEANFTKK